MVFTPLHAEILDNDLTLVYIGGRIGLEHGWSHIYSLQLQHQLFAQLRPHQLFHTGEWFISPPVYAWLMLPLFALGPQAATYVWLMVLLAALIAAWWIVAPGSGLTRGLWLIGAMAWYPVLYGLGLAQPVLAVFFIVAAAWALSRSGRPYLAGIVLGLTVIKPTLTLVLPLIFLFAGRWRLAAAYAVVAGVLAGISLLAIGPQGLADYRSLLGMEQAEPNNRYFTLAYPLGPGVFSYAASALVVAIATVGAYVNRHASDDRVFALGIAASALSATYWHLQDFSLLVLAAWLFWREPPPAWQRVWLLVVAVTAEFAWGFTPLPLLVALTVWFAFLVVSRRSTVVAPA